MLMYGYPKDDGHERLVVSWLGVQELAVLVLW
jgi:hypothetical protein